MKFSLSWLKAHLETDASLDEITEALTAIGHELEGLENPGEALGEFLSPKPHANGDGAESVMLAAAPTSLATAAASRPPLTQAVNSAAPRARSVAGTVIRHNTTATVTLATSPSPTASAGMPKPARSAGSAGASNRAGSCPFLIP